MTARGALRRAVAIALMSACAPATEVIVTVDTTFGVPCTIDALRFEVSGGGETVTEDVAVGDADLPGSISIATSGDARDVAVTVTGMRGGEPFATASDRATFDTHSALELRFILDRACVPGPCPSVGAGGYVGLPERQPRRGCGDTAYARVDSLFAMRDACDTSAEIHGQVLAGDDEAEAPSPLSPAMPFPFRFYGEPVEQIWIGTNGYITFGAEAPRALLANVGTPRSLGDGGGFPAAGVLAFWDNLRVGPRGVCLAVSGESPDRVLWITWKEACFPEGPVTPCRPTSLSTLTFSIALEETTDRVYVGYHTMLAAGAGDDRAKGNAATIGITNLGPRGCPAAACLADGTCAGDGSPCNYTELSAQKKIVLPTLELRPR